jgi:hypothetical protein
MGRYRKRPVVIEAVQYTAGYDGWWALNAWAQQWRDTDDDVVLRINSDGTLTIPTLEGDMRAVLGDWIIRGVQGEFYPCKPDIFDATYEPADEAVT